MIVIFDASHEEDGDAHVLGSAICEAIACQLEGRFVICAHEALIPNSFPRLKNTEIIPCASRLSGTASLREIARDRTSTTYRAMQYLSECAPEDRAAVISSCNTAGLVYHTRKMMAKTFIPPLATCIPYLGTFAGRKDALLIDAGANVEPSVEDLVRYAQMGRAYYGNIHKEYRRKLSTTWPTVGLLNNGTEDWKGQEVHRRAHEALQSLLPEAFIGNVEANSFLTWPADILLADGMSGNIVLKCAEGVSKTIGSLIRTRVEEEQALLHKLWLGTAARKLTSPIKQRLNADKGAQILGLPHGRLVVKMHGSCQPIAIKPTLNSTLESMINGLHILDA